MAEQPATDLSLQTLRALRRVLRATEIGNRRLAAETGLTPSQMLVLREIGGRSWTSLGRIARSLQFSQGAISMIVDRLQERELVLRRRNEQDRRQVHLSLLPAGRSLLDSAPDPLQTVFAGRFSALATWEQAMLLAAAERIAALVDAEGDAAGPDAAPLLDSGRIDRVNPG